MLTWHISGLIAVLHWLGLGLGLGVKVRGQGQGLGLKLGVRA